MVIGVTRKKHSYSCPARFYIGGPQSRIKYYQAVDGAKYYQGAIAFSPPCEPQKVDYGQVGELPGKRHHYNGHIAFPAPGDEICGTPQDMEGLTHWMPDPDLGCICDDGDNIGLVSIAGQTCPEPDEEGNVQCDIVPPCCEIPEGYIDKEEADELQIGGDTFIHIKTEDESNEGRAMKEASPLNLHESGCQCELCQSNRMKG